MATPKTDIQKMIRELNQYILPSALMECFDAYREEKYKEAIKPVPEPTLAWFLNMLNRYRGPEERKESLLEVFDPSMYTENHPAWERPPGTMIELPALTSEIVAKSREGVRAGGGGTGRTSAIPGSRRIIRRRRVDAVE